MALASLSSTLQSTPVHAEEIPTQVVSIDALITKDAKEYGVNENHLRATIACESQFQIQARGDHGLARGLSQIRSDYHPEVSDEEADSPEFAIDFMAKYFAANKATQWSCFRSLKAKYGDSSWPVNE